jgi:hypothetical protein
MLNCPHFRFSLLIPRLRLNSKSWCFQNHNRSYSTVKLRQDARCEHQDGLLGDFLSAYRAVLSEICKSLQLQKINKKKSNHNF